MKRKKNKRVMMIRKEKEEGNCFGLFSKSVI